MESPRERYESYLREGQTRGCDNDPATLTDEELVEDHEAHLHDYQRYSHPEEYNRPIIDHVCARLSTTRAEILRRMRP